MLCKKPGCNMIAKRPQIYCSAAHAPFSSLSNKEAPSKISSPAERALLRATMTKAAFIKMRAKELSEQRRRDRQELRVKMQRLKEAKKSISE